MEEVVQQINILNENIIRTNIRLGSIDARFNAMKSKIAIIDEKVESHDEQFKELMKNFIDINRKVTFHESKIRDFETDPKRTCNTKNASASAVTTPKVFQDCRIGVSLPQPCNNIAYEEAIELSKMNKAPAEGGKLKSAHFLKNILAV